MNIISYLYYFYSSYSIDYNIFLTYQSLKLLGIFNLLPRQCKDLGTLLVCSLPFLIYMSLLYPFLVILCFMIFFTVLFRNKTVLFYTVSSHLDLPTYLSFLFLFLLPLWSSFWSNLPLIVTLVQVYWWQIPLNVDCLKMPLWAPSFLNNSDGIEDTSVSLASRIICWKVN